MEGIIHREGNVTRIDSVYASKGALIPQQHVLPVSKAGAFTEQQRFVYRLRFFRQSEEGVVLYAGLPEGFTHISTGHGELQSVFARRLEHTTHTVRVN